MIVVYIAVDHLLISVIISFVSVGQLPMDGWMVVVVVAEAVIATRVFFSFFITKFLKLHETEIGFFFTFFHCVLCFIRMANIFFF